MRTRRPVAGSPELGEVAKVKFHRLVRHRDPLRLNRGGYMMAIGIRSLFVAAPLVFWLFGPAFSVIATIGILVALFRLDRHQVIN